MTNELAPLLVPFAWLYRAGVALHGAAYALGVARTTRLPEPVLSIGNLVAGGTGKTPAAIWLASRLLDLGYRPAILTRGYGRAGREPLLLLPGAELPDARAAGDEPLELARALPGVPIAIGRDRLAGAARARASVRPGLFLLDDGFQHRPLARSVDLVLLDAAAPFGNGRLLPAGALREPPGALRRADIVVLTRTDQAEDVALSRRQVSAWLRPGVPLFEADHRVTALLPYGNADGAGVGAPEGALLVTAGIAQPGAFARALEGAGHEVGRLVPFADHRNYTAEDLARVERAAGGRAIVTTRKDAIRWDAVTGGMRPGWWVAGVAFAPRDPEGLLAAVVQRLGPVTQE